MSKKITVEEAMAVIKKAMVDDNPAEQGSYAHSWHCNIAMMCYDSIIENLGASRFMKLCFGVDTKQ